MFVSILRVHIFDIACVNKFVYVCEFVSDCVCMLYIFYAVLYLMSNSKL